MSLGFKRKDGSWIAERWTPDPSFKMAAQPPANPEEGHADPYDQGKKGKLGEDSVASQKLPGLDSLE